MTVDYENDLVLVTCASGKQASELLPIIHGKWKHLRLAVKSDSSAKKLTEQYPDAEVVQVDLVNLTDINRIMKGVSIAVHVGPPGLPHETQAGYHMVDAAVHEAKSGAFKHFIYSSVFPTQLRKLMNHDCKRYVEEYLMESGLNWTILQPSHFFDNTPIALFLQQDEPAYQIPYNPEIAFSYTALRDHADAMARVMVESEKHYFALYPIISTMPTPYTEFLGHVGRVIGKPIKIQRKSLEEGFEAMKQRFAIEDPRSQDVFERLLLYYNSRGLQGNPSVTEWLLGRKATSCEEWAKLQVEALNGGKK